jgi:hypothetical protein
MQTFRGLIGCLLVGSAFSASAAERFLLSEKADETATWLVTSEIGGTGTLEFQPALKSDEAITHPITIEAGFRYAERRLPSAGRAEAAWRSFRHYDQARSRIRVREQTSLPELRPDRRRVVVQADRAGLLYYSPAGPMTSQEIELLPSLGDPLLVAALLPGREVSVGETWTPEPWVGPAIAGTEVSFNSSLTCRLQSVDDGQAIIAIDGKISGAAKGATTETTLAGTLQFDVAARSVAAAELKQTEKRSVGPVTPGMTLSLTAKLTKTPAPETAQIATAEVASIPFEPARDDLRIEHRLPFDARLVCDREWMAFKQTGSLLVLRLLDHGGMVAQCNVAPAPKVRPGERTPEEQFQQDIRASLGDQLTEIIAAEELKGPTARKLYRVTAKGKADESEMVWRYYLASDPDGRQAAFVFTAEASQLARLGDRDLDVVDSLEFLDQVEPTIAKPARPKSP